MNELATNEHYLDDSVTLTQRRIFIVPSQRGLGFIVLIVLLLLIAFVYNNNLAYLLTFLLSSVFFIAILHTWKSLAGLVLQGGQSKDVFLGEATGFDIHIHNPTALPRQHLQITLKKTESFCLEAFSKTTLTLYAISPKRGRHSIDKVTIFSTYPLGLFYTWSPIRFDCKALVYPKPANLEIAFPETPSAVFQQGYHKKGAEDFYGLHEYQAGDAIRHIHWKAFAKGQGLFSKQYGGESHSAEIWLNYDYTPGHNTEERLSQLCRWVIDAERLGIRYGFIIPGLRLAPDNGSTHYKHCLKALALL